jgi:hypothetical protein
MRLQQGGGSTFPLVNFASLRLSAGYSVQRNFCPPPLIFPPVHLCREVSDDDIAGRLIPLVNSDRWELI